MEKDGVSFVMNHGESLQEHTCYCRERERLEGRKKKEHGRGITSQGAAAPL